MCSGIFTLHGTDMADLHEINTTGDHCNRYELLVSLGNTSPLWRWLWYSFHCFSAPSLPRLSFSLLTPPVPDLLVCVCEYSLCSPLCVCQFVVSAPVMPLHVATLSFPAVSSPVSPSVPPWCVSVFCSSCFFHFFALCWNPFLLLLCLLSFWFSFGSWFLCVFQLCLNKAHFLFPYPASRVLSAFGSSPYLPNYNMEGLRQRHHSLYDKTPYHQQDLEAVILR